MQVIHLNIGSNQGDRKAIIGKAVALIANAFAPARLHLSSYIESEPWGYDSQNTFLNCGVMLEIDRHIDPEDVLLLTQKIEHEIGKGAPHRNPDGSYCDRPIDIDIIDIGRMTYKSPTLTLPHPRAHLRSFVMLPLLELDPQLHSNFGEIGQNHVSP